MTNGKAQHEVSLALSSLQGTTLPRPPLEGLLMNQRYRGCLLGLACGDAVGTTVEFKERGTFDPVTDMVGGGVFELEAGQWTDDTSMALCIAASLAACNGFDTKDQMQRFLRWYQDGYMSSTGACFDIGIATHDALVRFARTGDPYAGSSRPNTAGNGSLMRLAPVVLWFLPDTGKAIAMAAESSRTTHAAPEAIECCRVLAAVLCHVMQSGNLASQTEALTQPKVMAVANGSYLNKTRNEIRSSGYCVDSLEAALWCVHKTSNYRDAILLAANLGDDADTVAAITGQIAGALYGANGIPAEWLERLAQREVIEQLAVQMLRDRQPHLPSLGERPVLPVEEPV